MSTGPGRLADLWPLPLGLVFCNVPPTKCQTRIFGSPGPCRLVDLWPLPLRPVFCNAPPTKCQTLVQVMAFDVMGPAPSNSTIHSEKGGGYKVGHPLRFTSSLTAHPTPPWIQKRARRGSLAFGFRRLGAWPVQFNHPFKKGPDVPSGPLLFDVFFGPDVGQWPLAGDVLGHGPSNSTIHSKKGPTWITGPGLSTF